MWQRIQTLYLFLAILLNLAIYFFNLALLEVGESSYPFTLYGLKNAESGESLYSTMLLTGLCTVSILLSTIIIASFKKRQVQIKLAKLNLFIQAGFLVAIFFMIDNAISELPLLAESQISYSIGAFCCIPPFVLIYLAIRSIKKDDALVRAADRIR